MYSSIRNGLGICSHNYQFILALKICSYKKLSVANGTRVLWVQQYFRKLRKHALQNFCISVHIRLYLGRQHYFKPKTAKTHVPRLPTEPSTMPLPQVGILQCCNFSATLSKYSSILKFFIPLRDHRPAPEKKCLDRQTDGLQNDR